MASHTSTELRGHLQTFVEKHNVQTEGAKFYSHVLPSPKERTLSERNVVGKNWALIGDAAAWVDPLTAKGFSMRFVPANCWAARSPKAALKNIRPG